MKKRTAFIGAILSLIPFGQPLLIKTGVFLSSSAVMLSLTERVNAERTSKFYFDRGFEKGNKGDYYGAISDYTKAIEINPQYANAFKNRSISKENIGDIKGACEDAKKAVSLGDTASDNENWIKDNC